MNLQAIRSLWAYNVWANQQILASCTNISHDQFLQAVTPDPGWGSLRGILVHALDTEYGWRQLLQGQDASFVLETEAVPDVADLIRRWQAEHAAWEEYLTGLDDLQLSQGDGTNPSARPTVWQIVLHVINHGTQHRSEAAALLTGYGASPGELDLYGFLKEHPEYITPG